MDLVKEHGPAIGLFKNPRRGAVGSSEGTLAVAEEGRGDQVPTQSRAVHDPIRPASSAAGVVDSASYELLARARLAREENGLRVRREQGDLTP